MYKSRIVTVGGQRLHFLTMGSGPALIMMHPSPSSAMALVPLAKELAVNYTVFCIDTPGYGKSDVLANAPQNLTEYTKFLHQAFLKLGLEKPAIYGSATGAQLAIRYALEYPEFVSHIFLDNSAHFDDALSAKILESYFPDLTPQIDGAHLTQIWTIVTQMFQYFPWCFTTEAYALNRPQMPLFVLQMVAMDFLKAGAHYDVAYKLAFQHERGHYVQQLKVPTTIFRWNNSIITPYIDDLLAFEFPEHINAFHIDGSAPERTTKMVAFMKKTSDNMPIDLINSSAMEAFIDAKITYRKPNENPPDEKENGQHLQDAWQLLISNNENLNATEIQQCLVDWYTTI
ncbi:alpha/beta hydrolase [Maribacter sp.]|nr:alpha/beta hydrolase [Maribacter sp.]